MASFIPHNVSSFKSCVMVFDLNSEGIDLCHSCFYETPFNESFIGELKDELKTDPEFGLTENKEFVDELIFLSVPVEEALDILYGDAT